MTKQSPMLLAVAPNGARKQYKDHPALPITPAELADTAASCLAAGASMMHLHVRDENNENNGYQHCIDAKKYSQAFAAIRERIGDKLFLQATTEAVGIYSADEQMAMVHELADLQTGNPVFGVSLAVRELMADNVADKVINDFFIFLKDKNILPQLIIYDVADRNRFQHLLREGVLPGTAYPCLFVLGRYSEKQQSDPAELLPFFSDLYGVKNFMGCAFGAREYDVAMTATLLGGHMRIGYENNEYLANGRCSENNAELIQQAADGLATWQRYAASVAEAIIMMTPNWHHEPQKLS